MNIIRKFWKEYIELNDHFDRRNKIKELPFIKNLPKILKNISTDSEIEVLTYLIISQFQGYVDDIIELKNDKI